LTPSSSAARVNERSWCTQTKTCSARKSTSNGSPGIGNFLPDPARTLATVCKIKKFDGNYKVNRIA
jgi:hypothetical protein